MNTQHTPGPWFPDHRGNIWRRSPSELYENGGGIAGDKPIATVHVGWHHEGAQGYPLERNARLIASAPDLLEACQTFAEWLRRENAGFDHKTHNRETPEGEAAWREWFYGNIAICGLAQEQVRAAITKATGEKQ